MILEAIGLFFLIVFLWYLWENENSGQDPPGPAKIPILGNLIQVAMTDPVPYIALDKLSKKYGPVMSLKLGFTNAVILSSYKSIKEVLCKEEVIDRHCEGLVAERTFFKNIGLLTSSGKNWRLMRTFCSKNLRVSGFGKKSALESLLHQEIQDFTNYMNTVIKENNGKILFDAFFHATMLNNIWSLLAGEKFHYEDRKVGYQLEIIRRVVKTQSFASALAIAFPSLRYVFPKWTAYDIQRKGLDDIHEYFREVLREYREKLAFKSEPESFMDLFLTEIENVSGDSDTIFTDDQFVITIFDFFFAGSETTGSAMSFAVLFLALRPEIQDKLFKEIVSVVGSTTTTPGLHHREKMVYTEAYMLEIYRWGRIAVHFIPRKSNKEFYYKNMRIKKNTMVMANSHSIHFDETFWGDPEVFRPERYIDSSGCLIKSKVDQVLPFGVGKRICLGEALARDSFFLYLTTLVQNFEFKTVPGEPTLVTEPLVGFTLSPAPFYAIVTPRFK